MHRTTAEWTVLVSPRVLLGMLLTLGVLGMQSGRGTLAYFTSSASSTGNTFTAGTVVLKLTDANETALSAVSASIGASGFKPGQTAVGYLTVRNDGTLPFDYGLKYTATNTSGTLLVGGATDPELEVLTASATGDCTVANATGARTNLTSRYGPTDLSLAANTAVFDSGGGSKRSLANGTTEILCLAVSWPNGAAGAENAQQGGVANVDFNFDARQQ